MKNRDRKMDELFAQIDRMAQPVEAQGVGSQASGSQPRRKRRTAQEIALQRASRRSLAHQQRWKTMSEEQKTKILANLALGRQLRTDKYSKK